MTDPKHNEAVRDALEFRRRDFEVRLRGKNADAAVKAHWAERLEAVRAAEKAFKVFLDGDEMLPLTPANLDEMAEMTMKLRTDALFGIKDDATTDEVAEQHYLLALSFLETAAHHFKLAKLAQASALATQVKPI